MFNATGIDPGQTPRYGLDLQCLPFHGMHVNKISSNLQLR